MNEGLEELYQEIILNHNRRPRNSGELDPYTHKAEGFNPLCGDKLTVYLNKPGGALESVSCDCQGCAISTASGSIMTTMVEGSTIEEAEQLIADVQQMLTAKEDPVIDLAEQGDLAALIGVRKFPARIKCATLAWHALEAALRGSGTTTSE